MKRLVVSSIFALVLAGCAALQSVTPYLPTPDQIACAEVEADKGTPAPVVLTKCGFAQDALQLVEHLIFGHTKAKAMRAAALASDGGAEASK